MHQKQFKVLVFIVSNQYYSRQVSAHFKTSEITSVITSLISTIKGIGSQMYLLEVIPNFRIEEFSVERHS